MIPNPLNLTNEPLQEVLLRQAEQTRRQDERRAAEEASRAEQAKLREAAMKADAARRQEEASKRAATRQQQVSWIKLSEFVEFHFVVCWR